MKTEIYNLIVLDESGSMSGFRKSTISGCNETLNSIRTAQEKFAETQTHFVSIYVFQSDSNVPSRYIIKNAPITEVKDLTPDQYRPWGCTPLYDAVGSTLADLKAVVAGRELAIGNVTIITDGYENASEHYSASQIAKMIEALKELGWSFNFIGANIDVEATATSLCIDNALEFQQDEEGMKQMFERERVSRMQWAERSSADMSDYNVVMANCNSPEEAAEAKKAYFRRLKSSARNYFGSDLKK